MIWQKLPIMNMAGEIAGYYWVEIIATRAFMDMFRTNRIKDHLNTEN